MAFCTSINHHVKIWNLLFSCELCLQMFWVIFFFSTVLQVLPEDMSFFLFELLLYTISCLLNGYAFLTEILKVWPKVQRVCPKAQCCLICHLGQKSRTAIFILLFLLSIYWFKCERDHLSIIAALFSVCSICSVFNILLAHCHIQLFFFSF